VHKRHPAYLTGHTFTGHTAACAAGLAVQRIIEREGLLARVRSSGAALRTALRAALDKFDQVGDVRGRGYFIGIEFVRDRGTKEPFPKQRALSFDIGARAFADGLIVYPCSGNVNGIDGDSIVVSPPYNASDAELEEIIAKLCTAVEAALSSKM
jgi:adenosylmethionine-8-amino-7-oxononanoate aminotransferase